MPPTYPELLLRKGSERSLLNGHPWVYSGAVSHPPKDAAPGSIVDVFDHRHRFVCRGFYNPHSLIRVRKLTQDQNCAIDRPFFEETLTRAVQLRRQLPLLDQTNAVRLVHGESDGLPGLIVDDYAGYLVVQFHTHGMENFRDDLIDLLASLFTPLGIYERSDVGTRRAEGLPDRPTGALFGEAPPEYVEIEEHGVPLFVDLYRGQKTGLFLDQRDNRFLLQQFAREQSLLNCFAYSSGFSAHALKGGARRTLDVDISPQVLPAARRNLAANCPAESRCDYVIGNVFPFLEELSERGPRFDIVLLDPPSLLRKRSQYKHAMGVYTKLNRNALKLVRSGGLLVTASCSTRISYEDLFQIVRRAAVGARTQLRLLTYHHHTPDHPVDPAFPEGRYLKCIFARVFR